MNRVAPELNVDVSEDIRAANITANNIPRKPAISIFIKIIIRALTRFTMLVRMINA